MSLDLTPSDADGRVTAADSAVVARQLRRSPRDITGVAVRCPFGYPVVIETAPVLRGAPNPTLLYLTCPTMVAAVSRAETAGAVREFRVWVGTDEDARQALAEITVWYKRRRAFLARRQSFETRPDAGIGGPSEAGKASCLHAYAAALLAVMSGRLRDGQVEDPCSAGAAAAEPVAPGMTVGLEVAADQFLVAGETGTVFRTGVAKPLSDEASSRVSQRIWMRFLPPVEEIWCGDGACGRLKSRETPAS